MQIKSGHNLYVDIHEFNNSGTAIQNRFRKHIGTGSANITKQFTYTPSNENVSGIKLNFWTNKYGLKNK